MAPATVIGDLFVRLGVDLTAFNKDIMSAENRLESFGTRLFFLGSRVTAGVSIPVIAAGAAVAKFGLDFDKAMTESLAIMQGATPQIRAEMEEVAKSVATATKFSAKEAAEGYYSLASAGLDAATSMKALPIAAQFAQAGVFDLAKATHYLASSTAAMGTGMESASEKAAQMQRVADVLTEANNRALGTVKDFAEALTNRGALALRQSNIELEAGVAILAAYAERGITGAKAGQQLWMMLRDLQTHALESSKAFERHNIAVFTASGAMRPMADIIQDMQDRMSTLTVAQRAQMLVELGIPARSRAATQAILGQADAIRAHEEALKKAGGAAKDVADKQMEALSNQFRRLRNEVEVAAIELFKSFVPVIKDSVIPLAQMGVTALKGMADMFNAMPMPMRTAALGALALVAAIGPLTAMIGSMSLLASAAMRGLSVLAGGFGSLATSAGLAAGGINFARIAQLQVAAAAAAAAGNNTKLLQVASQLAPAMAALTQRQNDVWAAARMVALHQGASASAAMTAANAARVAERAYQATAVAQASAAASAGLLARAWMVLSNPITLWVAGLVAVGAGIYFATRRTDVLTDEIRANGEEFIKHTDRLNENMDAFLRLRTSHHQTAEMARELDTAIDGLAEASGVSREAFTTETTASDELTESLQKQLDLRNQLKAKIIDDARAAFEAAEKTVAALKKQQAALPDARIQVMSRIGHLTGEFPTREMTLDERLKELARLDGAIKKAEQDLAEAYGRLMGVTGAQVQGPPSSKPGADEAPGFPSETGKADKAFDKLRNSLIGVNEEAKELKRAWDSLTPAQRDNLGVQLNLWDAYEKLRGTTGGLIPAFENLFVVQLEQLRITGLVESQTKDYSNTWSEAATQVMSDAGKMHAAVTGMSDPQMAAFWKEHESVMEELAPRYGELDSSVQHLVRRYQEWKMALPLGKEFTEPAQRARQAMDDLLRETTAKMADLQSDIHQFSETAGETHRRVVRNKLEQIKADQEKVLRDRLKDLGRFTGDEHAAYITGLNRLRRSQKKYVEDYERYETLRYMQSIGVNAKILRDHKKYTQEKLNELTKEQEAWNRFIRDLMSATAGISAMGSIAEMLGLGELGSSLQGVGAGTAKIFEGLDQFRKAENLGQQIAAVATSLQGLVQAYKALADTAGRGNRALSGAASGAMIGAQFGGWYGAVVGGVVGGLVGLFMGDPSWEKLRKGIETQWNVNVSKELAKQIDATAKQTGNKTIAMFRHLGQIIDENGGLNAGNVGRWGRTLADAFTQMNRGLLPAWEAARALDDTFGNLVQSGTATSGMVNAQIVDLVKLERQYRTGSVAIKDFVAAQMQLVSEGFGAIVAGQFGIIVKSLKEYEEAMKNAEPESEEFRAAQQRLKEQTKLMAVGAQEDFDRLARLGMAAFGAMTASGMSYIQALTVMGPALTTLTDAQRLLGLEGSEAINQLLRMHDFIALHPELAAAIEGNKNLLVGLANTGFLTQGIFVDLGAQALDTFNAMIAQGLTADEAMGMMQPSLQALWEAQRRFGFELDESTQKLLDEAEASGKVGVQFMSATDRMILGIDTLIGRFDLFLQHLGVRIPDAAAEAADALVNEFENVNPRVRVRYYYEQDGESPYPPDPTELGKGGVLNRPTFVAGEAGAEVVMPLDRLFDEIEAMNRVQSASDDRAVKIYLDGRKIAEGLLPHHARAVRKFRLG